MHLARITSLIFLMVLFSCVTAAPYQCTYIFYYQPVCGSDGKTYINRGHLNCEAQKGPEKIELKNVGECTKASFTTMATLIAAKMKLENDPINKIVPDDDGNVNVGHPLFYLFVGLLQNSIYV
ncbi:hypothetical protein CHUAL_007741 [Chamberlinius hualienensis]